MGNSVPSSESDAGLYAEVCAIAVSTRLARFSHKFVGRQQANVVDAGTSAAILLRLKITECIFVHESFAQFRQFGDLVAGLRVRNVGWFSWMVDLSIGVPTDAVAYEL